MITIKTEWHEIPPHLIHMPYTEAIQILDDATCHGFEFKVENGKIYQREFMVTD